nr:MAG TPA: hypothetical protein [Caudoviricetes sp.]
MKILIFINDFICQVLASLPFVLSGLFPHKPSCFFKRFSFCPYDDVTCWVVSFRSNSFRVPHPFRI